MIEYGNTGEVCVQVSMAIEENPENAGLRY